MRKIFIFVAALIAVTSCGLKEEFQPVFSGTPGNPPAYKYYTDDDFFEIISIAQLSKMYTTGKPFEVEDDITIKGVVVSTDQPGNFYKSFYIQDETAGIEIKVGKNGLYNEYLLGQTVYVKLQGLTVGMYGYKSGNYGGMGMVQVGFADSTGEYETSYLEMSYLVDKHIFRGDPSQPAVVEPVVITERDLPNPKTDSQATNKYVGRLVTLKGLKYEDQIFCLLYLNSSKDKKSYTNRVFLSDTNGIDTMGKTHGVTTWAMSKNMMKDYLLAGYWDSCKIGSGQDFVKNPDGTDMTLGDLKGDGSYPDVEKAAYSVSQYFKMGSTEIQVRTSGYSKFADKEIPRSVRDGSATLDITGVISLYQGAIQFTVNNLSDFVVNGKPLE
ncbi:MAG: DUF5689 domain-containing protein [Bacteroidales bacterium]|nr:DUF5689 domain-containing protein [Bacteroidales bacterium]